MALSACDRSTASLFIRRASQESSLYHNEEYGITVIYPKDLTLCQVPKDEHDHGPLLIIDPVLAKGCNDADGGRFIEIFASCNCFEDTKMLPDFLKHMCKLYSAKDKCLPAPKDLDISGTLSLAARVDSSNDWVSIIVVTQAGDSDPQFDLSVPSVNYDIRLHTKRQFLERDLSVFRAVLHTLKLSPNPPKTQTAAVSRLRSSV